MVQAEIQEGVALINSMATLLTYWGCIGSLFVKYSTRWFNSLLGQPKITSQLSEAGIPDWAAHDKNSSAVVGDKSRDTHQ